jgi:hypothetical protein
LVAAPPPPRLDVDTDTDSNLKLHFPTMPKSLLSVPNEIISHNDHHNNTLRVVVDESKRKWTTDCPLSQAASGEHCTFNLDKIGAQNERWSRGQCDEVRRNRSLEVQVLQEDDINVR